MPIEMTTGGRIAQTSSKGNQEKRRENGRWYKLDQFGYEGLAETVASALLTRSNAGELGFSFVPYRTEKIRVRGRVRSGCCSPDFRQEGEAILTLADLFTKGIGPSWQKDAARLPNIRSRIEWIAEQTARMTDLENFGVYLTFLFEVDMLFGNEDRHLNNIAVLRRGEGFAYCPLFDFGAGLLSNVRDYPLDADPAAHIRQLRALPLGTTFTRQVRAAQAVYGRQLQWNAVPADIEEVLTDALEAYSERDAAYIADRVKTCIRTQRKKLGL